MLGASLALLLSAFSFAQDSSWRTAQFCGLNTTDSPAVIADCEAQDALNVEANLGGTALLKRRGFAQDAALTVTTSPVNGSHYFKDSSGNNVTVVCHDRYCSKSNNGGAFTVFLSTGGGSGNLPRRWSFVNLNGILYGGNDRQDAIFKLNGSLLTHPSEFPRGSILELTQDRLVVGDILNNPNRVYYSSAGAVEEYTTGANDEDPFYDDLGPPGEKVTGLKYQRGFMFVFKSNSITQCELGSQYTTHCSVLSPNIGTNDPASIVSAGNDIYFKGNDGAYWVLGGGGLDQVSRKIKGIVLSQVSGSQRSNTQTTTADWQAGTQFPTSSWSTTYFSGSIAPSTWSVTESLSASSSSRTPVALLNIGLEDGTTTSWTASAGSIGTISNPSPTTGYGSYLMNETGGSCATTPVLSNPVMQILDHTESVVISTTLIGQPILRTLDLSTQTFTTFKIRLNTIRGSVITSDSILPIRTLVFSFFANTCIPSGTAGLIFDVSEPSYPTVGHSTSTTFDTGFSTPTFGPFSASISSNSSSGVTFTVQSATSSSGDWSTAAAQALGQRIVAPQRRYLRYNSNWTNTISTFSAVIQDVTLNAATTGQFRTQCIETGSSISMFGTLSCAETRVGAGSLVYFATSAATCATLPSASPTGWQATVSNNAELSNVSTNTAVYIGWRSLLGSSTDQAQVDSCVLNWTEGTQAQPSWGAWDSLNNALYWTSQIGTATYSNRLLKYDINLGGWFPHNLTAQAPMMVNGSLYFGSSSSGTWNRYGGNDSDNGSAINAYWKTRDIGAAAPFQEKTFKRVSLLSRNQQSGSLSSTWTNSAGKTGTYTVSLSTGAGLNYARSNYVLPASSPQNFLNLQLGNNAANQPFEILGLQVDFFAEPWRVGGP